MKKCKTFIKIGGFVVFLLGIIFNCTPLFLIGLLGIFVGVTMDIIITNEIYNEGIRIIESEELKIKDSDLKDSDSDSDSESN